jgi:hypothetical protein
VKRARTRRAREDGDRLSVRVVLTMAAQDIFHAVLELQLSFFQGDFLELLGFGEVWLGGEFVKATLEFVVFGRELVKLVVALQLCL